MNQHDRRKIVRLPTKDKTLSFKRCEIRSGHFCYCYIDYWSVCNRKCKAGSTGKTDHRTCRRSDPDDILAMIDYVWLLNFYWILYGINIIALVMCKAVWNQCKWCTAVDRYRSDDFQPSSSAKYWLSYSLQNF